ncbi:MAG: sulfotransferase [Deltaproteobacteria bacterium]|nr:sulfotransferase [Deltaproteobacteria bacterium]
MTGQRWAANFEHPVALGSFRSWLRLARSSRHIEREYLPRLLAVSLSTLLTSPLRLYESVRYGRLVDRTAIHPAPIFILGHWRTGTTHLHNLLCQDRQFGYISTFQAMAPGFCLGGEHRLKSWLARKAQKDHPTREIDNMPLDLDAPQEESFALANMTPYAWLHLYTLPQQAAEIFDKYGLLHNLSAAERAEWKRAYLTLLRKATLRSGGKPLVLKDPANSGRVRVLLELFPQAKFIHICRDPYRVLPSMKGVYKVVLPKAQLQHISPQQIEALVLHFYEQLMCKYLAEKSLIPAGHLVEVKYEELEAAPLEQLRRIYDGLHLPGFAAAEPALRAYSDAVTNFQKNTYRVDDAVIDKVNRHWKFALQEWGYPRLEPLSATQAKA